MQDRVSLYPGRVTLTPVSGQANTYDLARADSPTQEGTPLSKANLLKDTTAALFGLGSAAVPDDVFQKLGKKEAFEVGDTLTTVRTDLGDKWLLCNGEGVKVTDYPLLDDFSVSSLAPYWDAFIRTTKTAINAVAQYNGTWVAIGNYNSIFVSTNGQVDTWTQYTPSTLSSLIANGIACYNGTWVAVGENSTGQNGYIGVTSDPTGTWTVQTTPDTYNRLLSVACYNGTWVAVGHRIYTATDPTAEWTEVLEVPDGSLKKVACHNGTWVAVGQDAYGDAIVYTTTTPSGAWTANTIAEDVQLNGIAYHDGVWVAVGHDYGSPYRPLVYTTTNPAGSWAGHEISTSDAYLQSVVHCGNKWVAVGYDHNDYDAYIYTAVDADGEWDGGYMENRSGDRLRDIASDGSVWVAVGNFDGSNSYPYYMSNFKLNIPSISLGDTYTYIKAKE